MRAAPCCRCCGRRWGLPAGVGSGCAAAPVERVPLLKRSEDGRQQQVDGPGEVERAFREGISVTRASQEPGPLLSVRCRQLQRGDVYLLCGNLLAFLFPCLLCSALLFCVSFTCCILSTQIMSFLGHKLVCTAVSLHGAVER